MQKDLPVCGGPTTRNIFTTPVEVIRDTRPLFAEISNSIDVVIGNIWYHKNRLLDAFDLVDELRTLRRLHHRIEVAEKTVNALRQVQFLLSYRCGPFGGFRYAYVLSHNEDRHPTDPVYSHISEDLLAVSRRLRDHRRRLDGAISICRFCMGHAEYLSTTRARSPCSQYKYEFRVYLHLLWYILNLIDHALTHLSYAQDFLSDCHFHFPCSEELAILLGHEVGHAGSRGNRQ